MKSENIRYGAKIFMYPGKPVRLENMEPCVVCWQLTSIPKNTPISERTHYILGQGQLCERCYYRLYKQGVFEG